MGYEEDFFTVDTASDMSKNAPWWFYPWKSLGKLKGCWIRDAADKFEITKNVVGPLGKDFGKQDKVLDCTIRVNKPEIRKEDRYIIQLKGMAESFKTRR